MPLLKLRRPSAVSRLVMAGGIRPAVERRFNRGAFAHVFQKCFETIHPPIANQDTFASPVFEAWVIGICDALLHRLPRIVGQRSRAFRRVTVLPRAGVAQLAAGAATGGVAATKPSDANRSLRAAITPAKPVRAAFFHVRESNCGQTSENLASDVEFAHCYTLAQSTRLASG